MPEPAENAPETESKKSRGLGGYIVWGFLMVMLDFLSAGPVAWMMVKRILGTSTSQKKVLNFVYTPWSHVYEKSFLHKPLGIYMNLWCPDQFNKNGDYL